jgi:TonB family protein
MVWPGVSLLIAVSALAQGGEPPLVADYLGEILTEMRMVRLPCTPDLEAASPGGAAVCAGPYYRLGKFRELWELYASEARPLDDWTRTEIAHQRRYALRGGVLQVRFDRDTGGVALLWTPGPLLPPDLAPLEEAAAADGDERRPSAVPLNRSDRRRADARTATRRGPTAPDDDPHAVPAEEVRRPAAAPPAAAPPVLIVDSRTAPLYPDWAWRARVEAQVELEVLVLVDGSVGKVKVVRSTNRGFEPSAMQAVRQWRFKPAVLEGRAVEAPTFVTVDFQRER